MIRILRRKIPIHIANIEHSEKQMQTPISRLFLVTSTAFPPSNFFKDDPSKKCHSPIWRNCNHNFWHRINQAIARANAVDSAIIDVVHLLLMPRFSLLNLREPWLIWFGVLVVKEEEECGIKPPAGVDFHSAIFVYSVKKFTRYHRRVRSCWISINRIEDPEDNKKLYNRSFKGVIVGVYKIRCHPTIVFVYVSARRFCLLCFLVKPHPAV